MNSQSKEVTPPGRFASMVTPPVTRLFRFRSLAIPERSEEIFATRRLYMQAASEFNDPWEATPIVQIRGKLKTMRRYLAGKAKREGIPRSARKVINEGLSDRADIDRRLPPTVWKSLGAVRVLSMSSVWNHPLMWSHYADGHKGYCLQLASSAPPFRFAFEVEYSNERPVYKYPQKKPDMVPELFQALLTKAEWWRYESEFRMLQYPEGQHTPYKIVDGCRLEFPANSLTGVIFGCRMPRDHRAMLEKWIADSDCNPTVYQAKMLENKFGLKRVKV